MHPYIGTKRVNAKPMTWAEYCTLRAIASADHDPDAEGYLVEYHDGGKSNHPDFAGYISWSPRDVFERAYKRTDTVEQEIQAKGLTAPRVTPADIEANIVSEHYFTAEQGVLGARATAFGIDSDEALKEAIGSPTPDALGLLTFCVLVLRNGFTVTGESACASPENFDPELGRKIARQHAVEKIWPLMGYALRTRLAQV